MESLTSPQPYPSAGPAPATPAGFQFQARRCDRVVKAVLTDFCVAFPRPAEAAEIRPGAISLHPQGGQAILSVGAFPRKSL